MSRIMMIVGAAVALAGPLSAQAKNAIGIPAGMCRIWVDGVPAGRQAAPTDCATAERSYRPPNSRIIRGAPRGGDVGRDGLKLTRDRDAQGRPIYRNADGRYVVRERTGDGSFVWRDAGVTAVNRGRVEARLPGNDGITKAEQERRRLEKERRARAEQERLRAESKTQKREATDARKRPR